jgi:hypothetical protein
MSSIPSIHTFSCLDAFSMPSIFQYSDISLSKSRLYLRIQVSPCPIAVYTSVFMYLLVPFPSIPRFSCIYLSNCRLYLSIDISPCPIAVYTQYSDISLFYCRLYPCIQIFVSTCFEDVLAQFRHLLATCRLYFRF